MLRAITGFCLAGLVMVAESWLNQAANNTNRGGVLATYMVVSLGAMAIGQFLLNLAPPSGANLFIRGFSIGLHFPGTIDHWLKLFDIGQKTLLLLAMSRPCSAAYKYIRIVLKKRKSQ